MKFFAGIFLTAANLISTAVFYNERGACDDRH
nr:MAG TPA: hypothetical protein [Caudoviricetes sp.]